MTVSLYHGPGLLTRRFLSLHNINISRCRNSLGISVLWSHRLAMERLSGEWPFEGNQPFGQTPMAMSRAAQTGGRVEARW